MSEIEHVICRWSTAFQCDVTGEECVFPGNDPHRCHLISQEMYNYALSLERLRNFIESEADYYFAMIKREIKRRYSDKEREG